MEEAPNEYLDLELESETTVRRRALLPWWIKVFIWLFMIMGVFAPFAIVFGFIGSTYDLSLYGLETNQPFSTVGIILIAVYLFKAVTALALWTESDLAIKMGYIDAIVGIIICLAVTLVFPFIDNQPGFQLTFRLELVLLVIYLIKLKRIEPDWDKG